MLEKVQGKHNLRRDTASGAIINVSSEAYHASKIRRQKMLEMDELKGEVKELKDLVMQLLKKLD
tara:strand:- start:570 stop:761 length:192 start_codon:yes stop_codon:yes gene_type:complete